MILLVWGGPLGQFIDVTLRTKTKVETSHEFSLCGITFIVCPLSRAAGTGCLLTFRTSHDLQCVKSQRTAGYRGTQPSRLLGSSVPRAPSFLESLIFWVSFRKIIQTISRRTAAPRTPTATLSAMVVGHTKEKA